jgi:hypothetical protein
MRKRPLALPLAILITTIALGISVPAFFLANRSSLASFSEVEPTPAGQANAPLSFQTDRDTDQIIKQNCTYHAYHWINNPDAWPAQVTLGGVTYTRADLLNLQNAPPGDPAVDLLKETIIAIVNIYNGASPASIESTLVEADNWLSNYQADGELSEFNQQQARSFTSVLEKFNNGLLYPASCADQIPSPATELASEEADQPGIPASPPSQTANDTVGAGHPVSHDNPALQPTPKTTDSPPARSTVKRPVETPIAPPPQADATTDNLEKDDPGRGNEKGDQGRGNGNGKDNPGKDNPGKGSDNNGQGKDKDKDKGNSGQDNKGQGTDKEKNKEKDNSGNGNQGGGKENTGLTDQEAVANQPDQSNPSRNEEDNPGKGKGGKGDSDKGKDKGDSDKAKDKDDSKKESDKNKSGKDKDK